MNGRLVKSLLIGADGFAALSAIAGGAMLVSGWPNQMPASMLEGTVFADYLIPGLILGLVVGGSAAVATAAVLTSRMAGAVLSLIAGCVMVGWIVGEVLILAVYAWLQLVYLLNGLVMIALAVRFAPGGVRAMARSVHIA